MPLLSNSLKKFFYFQHTGTRIVLKIDNITLDPDPNWAKIADPGPNSMNWFHNTGKL